MVRLSREIISHIVSEFSANEVLERFSDPYEKTINVLNRSLNKAKVDYSEKIKALKRLAKFRVPSSEFQVLSSECRTTRILY